MACDRSALKICSWNVGGVHNPIKRKKMLSFLKKEQVHVALLQETHLSNNEHLKLKCDWVGQVFNSSFTSKSRGAAILIKKHLPLTEVQTISDKSGRFVMLKGYLHGQMVSFMNIYCPPVQSNDFTSQVFSLLGDRIGDKVIAGDFNCYFPSVMDKSPPVQNPPSKRVKAVSDILNELDLVDIWFYIQMTRNLHFSQVQIKQVAKLTLFSPLKFHYVTLRAGVLGILLYQIMRLFM